MPDILFIHELCIETTIGLFEWERAIKQPIYLDVEMAIDTQRAAQTDNVQDTCNYQTVAQRLIAFVEANQFQLVEGLAEACPSLILQEFAITWVKLKVSKIQVVSQAKSAGIIIERGKRA